MTSTTIHLPDDTLKQVQDLATSTHRTVEEVLTAVTVAAVAKAVAYEVWFRAEVEKGLRSVEEGRLVPPEEVDAMWARLTTPEAVAEVEAQAAAEGWWK